MAQSEIIPLPVGRVLAITYVGEVFAAAAAPADLVRQLTSNFDCEAFTLDEGNALVLVPFTISFPTVGDGPMPFTPEHQRLLQLERWIAQFQVSLEFDPNNPRFRQFDRTTLWTPATRYRVGCVLPEEETEKSYAMTMRRSQDSEGLQEFVLQVYLKKSPRRTMLSADAEKLMDAWLARATSVGVRGEVVPAVISREMFSLRPRPNYLGQMLSEEAGLAFHFKGAGDVTWPWIELYLNLRRLLPKNHRPSFCFYSEEKWAQLRSEYHKSGSTD